MNVQSEFTQLVENWLIQLNIQVQFPMDRKVWDLVSKDGMDIAFGVYIFHVDAPGIGEKIGKFAIIK